MNCSKKIQPALITPELAINSIESPFFVEAKITQRLCFMTCAENAPVFDPRFSLKAVLNVGEDQYMLVVHVEGIISYVPCGGDCCCTEQQPLSQDFTIPLYSETDPKVTVMAGSSVNGMEVTGCRKCSRIFISTTPLTIRLA